MTDRVLIVGAGPVGLTAALELARYGVPVRIIDKLPEATHTSRAVAIWPRTLELLDRSGATADLLAIGNRVTAANMISGGRLIAHITLDDTPSLYPFALMLPQYDTEGVLRRRLDAIGIQPAFATELLDFQQDADGVTAVLGGPDGQKTSERYAWLIGCDGAHSVVRHRLGLEFRGDTIGLDWTQGDFYLTGAPFPASELAFYASPDGLLLFFPMSADRYRIIASLGPSTGAEPVALDRDAFQKLIDRLGPGGIRLTDTVWTSAFRINERQVERYRSDRVFLAGDAAHVHSPAGGQGMNTGMHDAVNLAWKLALACRGTSAAPALLASYDAERRPVGADVIEASGRMTKAATLSNHTLQHLRDAAAHLLLGLPPVHRALTGMITETAIGYQASPLNGPTEVSDLQAGSRVAPIAGEAPYGSGDAPRFSLRGEGEAALQIAAAYPALVERQLRPPLAAGSIALVRPDGYLAASVADAAWRALLVYLDRLGPAPR